MRNSIVLFALILFFSCNNKENDILPQYYQTIKNYCSSFPDSTELSIAIINGHDVSYLGFIKKGDSLIYVDNHKSVFVIASITKVFTSALLAQFVIDSIIDINEPIENYLGFNLNQSGYSTSKVTLKTLANHTSGFPRMPYNPRNKTENKTDSKNFSSDSLKDYLASHIRLKSEPGFEYSYSNLGYAALGYVMEEITHLTYEEMLQQKICDKYNLKYTTIDYLKIKDLLVSGRDSAGNTILQTDLNLYKPAGGIYSNIEDLTKFIKANFNQNQVLDYQREETFRLGSFGVALGWSKRYFGGANCSWYGHNGKLDGYRSSCVINVPSKSAIIILSNVSQYHKDNEAIVNLAYELIKQEYLRNHSNEKCSYSFLESALNNGWGATRRDSLIQNQINSNSIVGVWQHLVNDRIVTKTFFKNNKVQTDFYEDKEIDVWGYYEINGNKISIMDIGGAACNTEGIYEYKILGDTLRFIEISDKCDGRKAGNVIDWIRIKK